MKRLAGVLLLSGLGFGNLTAGEIQKSLREALEKSAADETHPVVVIFKDRVDLSKYEPSQSAELIRALQARREELRKSFEPIRKANKITDDSMYYSWIAGCVFLQADTAAIKALAQEPMVDLIESDSGGAGTGEFVGEAQSFPKSAEGNIIEVGASLLWRDYGLTGDGVVVGVMDSGFHAFHEALFGKWRGGSNSWWDYYSPGSNPYDDHGHGSHVSGIILGGDGSVGAQENDIGAAYNAQLVSAKVLDSGNSFSSGSIVVQGAEFMLDPDGNPDTADFPRVINNSWSFSNPTTSFFYDAAEAWRAAGIIPIFAAGNSSNTVHVPAAYDNVIGVSAYDHRDGNFASFSCRGPAPVGEIFPPDRRKPDFAAPGVLIRSAYRDYSYALFNGTSMAAPHIAAAAAVAMEADPEITYDEFYDLMVETSRDFGDPNYDYLFGFGAPDFLAIGERLQDPAPTPSPSPSPSPSPLPSPPPSPSPTPSPSPSPSPDPGSQGVLFY